jgi:thymidylate synthase ThyX
MVKIEGKGNISAEIVADSISDVVDDKRIITYVLEYPRFIHSEFMTHRSFSRNAASSRAIPVKKVIELVENTPAMPIHWGMNQAGMQAKEELSGLSLETAQYEWAEASKSAMWFANRLKRLGAHKQIVNRILEPYQMIRVVCTATEYDNFFYLRYHADAQPEISELARVMWEARELSEPELLQPGEWHTPFVNTSRDAAGKRYYWNFISDTEKVEISLEDALKVSASCCAQVSYRKLDTSLEKALDIYNKLVTMKPVHASPTEHQATPMENIFGEDYVDVEIRPQKGVTHNDIKGNGWSANFCGWIQHRQLIPDNVCNNFVKEVE